jgi:curved DNA-binding protein CbpA
MNTDPFRALGLPARPDLTDDDVRAAWRRIAAATHPDRDDGGDPARFAEAAAAYTELRTASGRGEAYADLAAGRAGRRSAAAASAQAAPPGQAAPPRRGGMAGEKIPPGREETGDTGAAAGVAPGMAAPGRMTPGRMTPGRMTPGRMAPGGMAPGRAIPDAAHWFARLAMFPARIRRGRPALLALRAAIAAGISLGAVAVAGFQPATPALIVGVLTWLIRTGRHDLAPPPARLTQGQPSGTPMRRSAAGR